MRVLIAPDSFKGSVPAAAVARAIAEGWRVQCPHDTVVELPQADGGEGTVDAIAATGSWLSQRVRVTGPDHRPVTARWIRDESCSAVIELAESSGIALMGALSPVAATSRGLGEVLAAALADGAREIQVGLGGSASTDGGFGVLCALGLRAYDRRGRLLDDTGVDAVAAVDPSGLLPLPVGSVEALVDTAATLFGPAGAAHVFGPQKGADADVLRYLDDRLRHWSDVLAAAGLTADPARPGAGAAGGVGYALACWGATLTSGADRVAARTGLTAAIPDADVVVTGEGRFDATSLHGKVVGRVLDRCEAAGVPTVVVAGQVAAGMPGDVVALTEIAGGVAGAMADPLRWLRDAGARAAAHRAYATAAQP